MTRAATALDGLYGKASALAGTVGGQDREQEAWSPLWAIEAARAALGGRIVLDPCGASAWELPEVQDPKRPGKVKRAALVGGWFADLTLTGPGGYTGPSPHGGTCVAISGLDGVWGAPTFFNPPYDALEAWLAAATRAAENGHPIVGLYPSRPRRAWWVEHSVGAARNGGSLVHLRYDVCFQGYKSAHPENMCLVSWNCRLPDLGGRETWRVGA